MRSFMTFVLFAALTSSASYSSGQISDPFAQPAPLDAASAASDPFAPSPPRINSSGRQGAEKRVIQNAKTKVVREQIPPRVDSSEPKDVEAALIAALSEHTSMSFIETPLCDAIQTLSKAHNLPMVIDRRALEEIGLDEEVGITVDLKDISLRSFLRLMLRDLDLTYTIKDEVMQITTREAAEQSLTIQMYTLPKQFDAKSDDLIRVTQMLVSPESWESLGGNSTMVAFDHVLLVSTTSDVHQQFKEFLLNLMQKYGEKDED